MDVYQSYSTGGGDATVLEENWRSLLILVDQPLGQGQNNLVNFVWQAICVGIWGI